uniref:hypothetical protein n=1 Tax=Klebsiella pneumoniae TaxID=573 RepID=UPI00280AEDBC
TAGCLAMVIVRGASSAVLWTQQLRLMQSSAALEQQWQTLAQQQAQFEQRIAGVETRQQQTEPPKPLVSAVTQEQLTQALAENRQEVNQQHAQLQQQMTSVTQRVEVLEQRDGALSGQWLELKQQMADLLAGRKSALAPSSSSAVANPLKKPVKKTAAKVISSASAPFVLNGVEYRGGAPRHASSLEQVRLLTPGESFSGWMLLTIDSRQATFRTAGRTLTLSVH